MASVAPAPAPAPARWWPVLRPRKATATRARLLLFPHSGAGPNTLLPLSRGLPQDIEVLGLCLPGRERRYTEPPGCALRDVLCSVTDEITGRAPMPTVVFGHSLGALLAAHVVRALGADCIAAVVSGQLPGDGRRPAHEAYSDKELLRLLRDGGGTPEHILRDPALRDRMARTLRADLRLSREAAKDFGALRLRTPLTVLGGADDPLVPRERLPRWAAHTSGECRIRVLPGGHFFLLDQGSGLSAVEEELSRALAVG